MRKSILLFAGASLLAVSLAAFVTYLMVGLRYFQRVERSFADVI